MKQNLTSMQSNHYVSLNKMNSVTVISFKISPDQNLFVNIKKQNKYLNHK